MKTPIKPSIVSDLILACFFLSLFLLLENDKESKEQQKPKQATSENINLPLLEDSDLFKDYEAFSFNIKQL